MGWGERYILSPPGPVISLLPSLLVRTKEEGTGLVQVRQRRHKANSRSVTSPNLEASYGWVPSILGWPSVIFTFVTGPPVPGQTWEMPAGAGQLTSMTLLGGGQRIGEKPGGTLAWLLFPISKALEAPLRVKSDK